MDCYDEIYAAIAFGIPSSLCWGFLENIISVMFLVLLS